MKYWEKRDKETIDNKITNELVKKGKLPKEEEEIYNNPHPNKKFKKESKHKMYDKETVKKALKKINN